MPNEKADLKKIKRITEDFIKNFYNGNPEPWLSLFLNESIYIGNDGQFIFGGNSIRDYFKDFCGRTMDISGEEYYASVLSDNLALAYGKFAIRSGKSKIYAVTHFSIIYRITDEGYRIVCQHKSYDYYRGSRIPLKSRHTVIYVNPYTILYAESKHNRSNLVCIDRVISCNNSIGELSKNFRAFFIRFTAAILST